MAYGKTRFKFRRRILSRRRKRYTKPRSRIPRLLNQKGGTYKFIRHTTFAPIKKTNINGTNYFPVFTFALDDLPNYSEFQNLFDQYKIHCVVISFVPTFTENNFFDMLNAEVSAMPRIQSIIDLDDDTALGSENEMLQYQYVKKTRGNRVHTRKIFPRVQSPVYDNLLSFGYATNRGKPWIDTTKADVPHYGLKVMVDAVTSSTSAVNMDLWRIEATYYLSFRTVK